MLWSIWLSPLRGTALTPLQAKKFVESVPQVLKENVPKEDAEKLQKTLTDLGATVTLS
jgi:large subunit ribosomal protein L7/L12